MNINKIDELLDIKPDINSLNVGETSIEEIPEKNELVKYTNNQKLIKEIDRYISERENSLESLLTARNIIQGVLNNGTLERSINNGADWKDIDAFSKLLNTLTNITQKIDDIANPQKVETYIDPVENKNDNSETGNITNIQNNIFTANPAEFFNMLKRKTES